MCQSGDLGLIVIQAQNLDVLEETAGVFSAACSCSWIKQGAYQPSWAPSPVRSVFYGASLEQYHSPFQQREEDFYAVLCWAVILYNLRVFGVSSLWMEKMQHFGFFCTKNIDIINRKCLVYFFLFMTIVIMLKLNMFKRLLYWCYCETCRVLCANVTMPFHWLDLLSRNRF